MTAQVSKVQLFQVFAAPAIQTCLKIPTVQTIQTCGEILQSLMNVNVQISCQGILIIAARLISLNKPKQALELLLMK